MMYSKTKEIKDRALRLYNKAREIVEANPRTYNKELVYKLMMEEKEVLKELAQLK